ncbi:MAG: ribonuclease III [Dehalococcoidia bacterium]|nr:ribonuclease III [Dehalococcoidia bacterium]
MKHSPRQIAEIAAALELEFDDISLLEQALVHGSFVSEFPGVFEESNQRLEFLGDAVLGLIVAQELMTRFPEWPEGRMTQVRATLVDGQSLSEIGARLGLGKWLVMGRGEIDRGGSERKSNLVDAFEALVGALFLDQGYEASREFALRVMDPELEIAAEAETAPRHPKSLLHEAAMERGYGPPVYETVGMKGSSHDPTFTVQAVVNGVAMGTGQGRSKKVAGAEAAVAALGALGSG